MIISETEWYAIVWSSPTTLAEVLKKYFFIQAGRSGSGAICSETWERLAEEAAKFIAAQSESARNGPSDTEMLNWMDNTREGNVRGTDVRRWAIEAPNEELRTLRGAIRSSMEK